MSDILKELDAIFNAPFKFWFCDKCPRDKQSVEWHDDNAKCLNCGRTRVQWLTDLLDAARTPGPATARMRGVAAKHLTPIIKGSTLQVILVKIDDLKAFVAEWPTNTNAPACEDRGGKADDVD